MADVLIKQPQESLLFDFDLSQVMRSGDTISSVGTITQVRMHEVPGSSDLTIGSPTFSGQTVQVRISGGTNGERYKLTGLASTAGGDSIEFEGVLWIRDL